MDDRSDPGVGGDGDVAAMGADTDIEPSTKPSRLVLPAGVGGILDADVSQAGRCDGRTGLMVLTPCGTQIAVAPDGRVVGARAAPNIKQLSCALTAQHETSHLVEQHDRCIDSLNDDLDAINEGLVAANVRHKRLEGETRELRTDVVSDFRSHNERISDQAEEIAQLQNDVRTLYSAVTMYKQWCADLESAVAKLERMGMAKMGDGATDPDQTTILDNSLVPDEVLDKGEGR